MSLSATLYRSMGNLMYMGYPLGNFGRLALLEGDTAAPPRAGGPNRAVKRCGCHLPNMVYNTREA
jgi:hypothetical protein